MHEAAALQEDLRRAHIEPFAWIINQSLLNSGSCDPLLQRREAAEHPYLSEVVERHEGLPMLALFKSSKKQEFVQAW